jgi:hypothetical protein
MNRNGLLAEFTVHDRKKALLRPQSTKVTLALLRVLWALAGAREMSGWT